jgi:hypothetical protein
MKTSTLHFLPVVIATALMAGSPALSQTCTGLCLEQITCPGTATTSISGTVYAPNGTDPLPGVLVYVPNGAAGAPTWGVEPFPAGVACNAGDQTVASGSPLVATVTDVHGNFALYNMPVGANIPLVIQAGKWRRQLIIPSVAPCVTTALAGSFALMPQNHTQGNIPLIALDTGAVSAIECVLRKVGVADSEFSDPTGAGRIQFYTGSGGPGAQYSASTPSEAQLWGTQASLDAYDVVIFGCQGAEYDQGASSQQNVINYANAGGQIYAEHDAYVWLYDDAPFSLTARWAVDPSNMNTFANDPATATVNQGFAQGQQLAEWLQTIGASTFSGQVQIASLQKDQNGVNPPTEPWLSVTDADLGNVVMQFTFDTPIGAAPANQCGRVQFNDYHVEDAAANPTTGLFFPSECATVPMTPMDHLLEYQLFNQPTVAPQTITFGAIANQVITTPPFTLTATASSELPVSFAVQGGCGVSGNTVTLTAAGTCTITATQAGTNAWQAAAPVMQSFQVTQATQTITFNLLANEPMGTPPFGVSASASSGLPVSFASTAPSNCGVSGGTVTLLNVGTCSIQATQPGNTDYAAAMPVTQSFQITQGTQTITFGPIANQGFGTPVTLTATASSGLQVSFASTTGTVCTVSGNTATILKLGTCTIKATQAGNANFTAAASMKQSFTVVKGTQTITFGALPSEPYSTAPFTVSAAASSGLPVSFASTTTTVCTVSGDTVTLVLPGHCSIRATQAGNADYKAAAPVTQAFTVTKDSQTISFAPLSNKPLSTPPFTVSATATSGLPASFSSSTTEICTISGDTVTLVAVGKCTIHATQAGNTDYAAAKPVNQSFHVTAH